MRATRSVVTEAVLALALVLGCGDSPGGSAAGAGGAGGSGGTTGEAELARRVVETYAANVRGAYAAALGKARLLETAIDAMVTAPSAETLAAARRAWAEARPAYLETEAFRFYGGPIDDATSGPEGRLNGWPLDESYIDYTKDQPRAGIINDPVTFPTLDKDTLAALNEQGGEKNLATGYHALEFLLWGQDLNDAGHEREPGRRPHTDYVVGPGGTAQNQARRGAYLRAVTALVVEDLTALEAAWDLGRPDSYGARFVAASGQASIEKMLQGIAFLAGTELSRERMNNAYLSREQEEEHSCFSDTTAQLDHLHDALGIQNVWLGQGVVADGPGLDELVRARDPQLADRVTARVAEMVEAIRGIPAPFDVAIADDAAGRPRIAEAVERTIGLGNALLDAASALGVRVNIER